jgi:hypothetical protein
VFSFSTKRTKAEKGGESAFPWSFASPLHRFDSAIAPDGGTCSDGGRFAGTSSDAHANCGSVVPIAWKKTRGMTLPQKRKRRSPRGPRRSLLEHYNVRTKAMRPRSSARQLHRSVHPLDPVARVTMSLRASLYGLLASTRFRLTMNLATHQRAQRRDRTNVYLCHLDHLLLVAVG